MSSEREEAIPEVSRPVSVRRLLDADRSRWRTLWKGYLSFYRAEVTDDVTDLTFRCLRDGGQGMLGLVAVDADEEPIGFAHLVFHAARLLAHPAIQRRGEVAVRHRRPTHLVRRL